MPDVISDCRKSELLRFAILQKLHKLKSLFGRSYVRMFQTHMEFEKIWLIVFKHTPTLDIVQMTSNGIHLSLGI